MYEVKYRSKNESKTIHMVFEKTASIAETIDTLNAITTVDEIFSVCLSKFVEVYYSEREADELKWYEVSLTEHGVDERTGKARKTKHHILVQAPDFDECCDQVKKIASMGYDMERNTIRESGITGVTDLTQSVKLNLEEESEDA